MPVWTLERILKGAAKLRASDVHLVRGLAPVFRVNGDVCPTEGEPLDESTLRSILEDSTSERQRNSLEETWQLCFSGHLNNVGRFRASIDYRAGCPEFAIRLCENTVRTLESLGLPPFIEELARRSNGLVLITGPTGVGKTTTMNFMIDAINRNRRAKIVTIEPDRVRPSERP
jgi:twitching motility protein PilT